MSNGNLTLHVSSDTGWLVGAKLSIINGGLRLRRLDRGLLQCELAKKVGCKGSAISHIETLRQRPSDALRDRLAKYFDCSPQDIWPDWLTAYRKGLKTEAYQQVEETSFSQLSANLVESLTMPDTPQLEFDQQMLSEEIEALLAQLSLRERKIIRGRFGMDGRRLMLKELGSVYGITKDRVRQIELRALNKLAELRNEQLNKGNGQGEQ